MSVKSPRAYAAYARDVPAGPTRSGSAPDSRPLRARVAVRLRLLVRLGELPHHLLAPLVQSLEPPLLSFGERVRGEDREADGVVEVAHHRARELVGVHLPPAHGFGRPPPMIRMPLLPPWVFASNTMADVSFTSALGSNRSCDPVSACSATFIPMDESPATRCRSA